ncbi:hypothetical protein BKA62DRAFT_674813 [Auriculariales sp. MPI-PUGE-AT-0066]|nr:hypothetical protein BKA62DRAFT_674813 [Auriculariales sp. MPI-PUGE-AT-0066]
MAALNLVRERDAALQNLTEERSELLRGTAALKERLKAMEDKFTRYKEDVSNLEVDVQDLDEEVLRLNDELTGARVATLAPHHSSSARDLAGDEHKAESQRLSTTLEDLFTKYQTEVGRLRTDLDASRASQQPTAAVPAGEVHVDDDAVGALTTCLSGNTPRPSSKWRRWMQTLFKPGRRRESLPLASLTEEAEVS